MTQKTQQTEPVTGRAKRALLATQRHSWEQVVAAQAFLELGSVDQPREQIQSELGDRELPPPEEILLQLREYRDTKFLALHSRQPGHAPQIL